MMIIPHLSKSAQKMAELLETPAEDITEPHGFSIDLTYYVASVTGKGAKSVKKNKTKQLELTLQDSDDGYVNFLKAALEKVGENSNPICKDNPYAFRFFAPPMRKTQAVSVENFGDYSAMMQSIKPKVRTTILIDMSDVKEKLSVSHMSFWR